ncbi:hypothetical protein EJD97_009398, partial [Solanum chilense]
DYHLLGGGDSKEVYVGWNHVQQIEIAWNQIVYYEDDEKLFTEEATLLKSLNHERIIKCCHYWFDSESKILNTITELFSSGSLKKYIHNGVGVDLVSIKNWGRQILQGLCFLHSQSPKIIHRDIKCDNVFVASDGKQFGLAVCIMDGDFVKEKEPKCTPEFMAPMCLLEMVTGEYPYMKCSNQMHIFKKVYTGVKPVSLGNVKDYRVRDIIEKCILPMSVRPSAEELLKDPFFLYNGRSSTFETCAPVDNILTSRAMNIKHLYLV